MRELHAFLQTASRMIATCGVLVLATACGDDKPAEGADGPPKAQAASVRTTIVQEEELTFYDSYPGTVTPLEQVEIRPQVSGYITAVHFKEGDAVRMGQRLYTVDTRNYQTGVATAEASISTAEANLALAEKDVERYRRLNAAEAIATQTLDRAVAQAEVYRQQLAAAQAQKRSANTQLSYTNVTAPISGETSLMSAKIGTQVSPGQPLLTTVSQSAPIGIDFALPQNDIFRFSKLEGKSLEQLDSTFRIRLPGAELYAEYGRVYALDRTVDPRTGNLTVRLEFANKSGLLRAGMNVEVEVLNDRSGRVLTVPDPAIGEQMGEFYVYVVKDSLALRRTVQTGKPVRGNTVVTQGVSAGDQVVIEGVKSLRDSARVKVMPPQTQGAPSQAASGPGNAAPAASPR